MAKHAGNFNDTIISFYKSKQIADPQNIKKTLFFFNRDACVTRGYAYTWCNKRRLSKIGTWSDSDHCR